MTPEQKVKFLIIAKCYAWEGRMPPADGEVTAENIDAVYDAIEEKWDAINEIRGGEVETGLDAGYSRNYELKSVAAKMPDGSWVGWTYFYGGGKHGNPEEIEWIDGAYEVQCVEEEKMVVVRTFTKAEAETTA